MKICRLFVLAMSAVMLVSAPAYAQQGEFQVGGSVSPKIVAMAQDWFYRVQTGRLDRSQLDVRCNGEITDEVVAQEAAALRPLGKPVGFYYVGATHAQHAVGYYFTITFSAATVVEAIAFDDDGKIGELDFQTVVAR